MEAPDEEEEKKEEDDGGKKGKGAKKEAKKEKKEGKGKKGKGAKGDGEAKQKVEQTGPTEVVLKFEMQYDDYANIWTKRDETDNHE